MNNDFKINLNCSNKTENNLLIHQTFKQFDVFNKETSFKYLTTSIDEVLNRFAIW